jgi:hypothetical protein
VTGLHARSEDDWVRALERCLDDDNLRQRLARAGRAAVETRYSAEAQAPVVGALIRSLTQ